MARTPMSPHFDILDVVWPRILGVRRIFMANMDVPHAMGRATLATELRAPVRFPGVPHSRTDSVITVQSRLRGLPYFDALNLDTQRRMQLNLGAQSGPREPTGTKRQ